MEDGRVMKIETRDEIDLQVGKLDRGRGQVKKLVRILIYNSPISLQIF